MMKKVIKKLLAALLAVAMVCAMAIPAFAYDTKEDIDKNHCYDAFQIFKGDVSDDNTISNVQWGQNIPDDKDFLAQLKEDPTLRIPFQDANSLQEVLDVMRRAGQLLMITASLSRVLYATISTRMPMQTRHPSNKVVTPVASNLMRQVII